MSVFRKILTTTDFSDPANLGLDEAERLARETGAELVVLHVVATEPPPGIDSDTQDRIMQERRQEAQQALRDLLAQRDSGVETKSIVAIGDPGKKIGVVAGDEGVDLIVMSSQGRSAIGRLLLGSTAEDVLRRSRCPVLIVPFRQAET